MCIEINMLLGPTQIPQFFQFGSAVKFRQLSNELDLPEKINVCYFLTAYLMFIFLINGLRSLKEFEMSQDSISAFRGWYLISQLSLSGNKLRK